MCARKVLDSHKNCVVLALSDTLNIDKETLYSRLESLGFGSDFTLLENTENIKSALGLLSFTSVVFERRDWSNIQATITTKGVGRYFAVNTNKHLIDEDFVGHAFCMVLNSGARGPAILGNNAATATRKYLPDPTDNIYVWRPATPAVALSVPSKPKKIK